MHRVIERVSKVKKAKGIHHAGPASGPGLPRPGWVALATALANRSSLGCAASNRL